MKRRSLRSLIIAFFFAIAVSAVLADDDTKNMREIDCRSINLMLNKFCSNCPLVELNDLNEDVQDYFKTTYPGSYPGCVKEDFDGDGVADYALLVRTKVGGTIIEQLLVLKGKGENEFTLLNLEEFQHRIRDLFIRRILPGRIDHWAGSKTVIIDRPGFELVLFESASRAYYWKGRGFESLQTED